MQLNEETIGHTTILSPQDDLDITTLPAFEARLSRLINGGTRNLIWELSDVPFLPSTAAGFLLQTARRMRDAGGRLSSWGAPAASPAPCGPWASSTCFPPFRTEPRLWRSWRRSASSRTKQEFRSAPSPEARA